MESIQNMMSQVMYKRPAELWELKKQGVKVVGFPPGGYIPEELIYAAGAAPVCLFRGGDPEAVAVSTAYLPRFVDTFCRSQIGYWALGEDPYYKILDLLVAPATDSSARAIADSLSFYAGIGVFTFGVPHHVEQPAFDYYLEGLRSVRAKLEEVTGNKISDDKLKETISLYNRIRSSIREISLLRKSEAIPISGKDFMLINHASYLLDPASCADQLEAILDEIKQAGGKKMSPRLLLTASTLAFGDYKVLNLIEENNADVVIEEIPEGIRPYWNDVSLDGDPLAALAETHFRKRVPPAYFRPCLSRLDFIINLAREFRVDGIIWYQLMYRESYDVQSFYFAKRVKEELGFPMLKLQSDYDAFETGPFRTRIQTYLETIDG